MTPVDQEFPHDPDNGVAGDCYRACIASLLDVPTADVPHFLHDFPSAEEADRRVADFLRPLGLALVTFHYHGEGQTPIFPEGVHYILHGKSPRFSGKQADGSVTVHCVIATEGLKVVHDPHPTRHGILGAFEDPDTGDKWWAVSMLVRATGGTAEQLPVWRQCPSCERDNRVHRQSCVGCGLELRDPPPSKRYETKREAA